MTEEMVGRRREGEDEGMREGMQLEIGIWKSRNKDNQEARMRAEKELTEIKDYMELMEQEKFGYQSSNN